jgi:hypothetical protein
MKQISTITFTDENGNQTIIDERIFDMVVTNQIETIKNLAKEEILNRYPEFKQRNAALGILSAEEENDLKRGIESIRNYSNLLEHQIQGVLWDGTEEDRKRACDEVQAIYWNYERQGTISSKRYTAYQFLLRFTPQERASFREAAKTDLIVADFQQLAQAAQEIRVDDPITVAGMNYLVSLGLLTEQRKIEILT